jgi:molybdopterin synthase catalytic subunit
VDGPTTSKWCQQILNAQSNIGCTLAFSGRVRESNNSRNDVSAIDYHVYPEMFETEIEKIVNELAERFEVETIAVEHSTGRINLGEESIHVLLSAEHRKHCFDFLEQFMLEFKARVPIFKKEIYADGEEWLHSQE